MIKNFFGSLIPRFVNNRIVIAVFDLFRKIPSGHHRQYRNHTQENQERFATHASDIARHHGYIEDQHHYDDMRYGKTTIQYAGCEIIAVYNALVNLNRREDIDFPALIHNFEKSGMVFSGLFGTSPKSLKRFLEHTGMSCRMETKQKNFAQLAEEAEVLIYTFYNNRRNIFDQVHTICITKKSDQFFAHNVSGNGTVLGPYGTIDALFHGINQGKAKGICLIGISG